MNEIKHFSLIKPTLDTPFHVDFTWWKEHDNNWRLYLHSCLCQEHQETFSDLESDSAMDWINPKTAEIQQVDGLQNILISHCAKQPQFINDHTTLVDAVFRALMANGNIPMTPVELGGKLQRPADTILRTISGPRVYRGLRPIQP